MKQIEKAGGIVVNSVGDILLITNDLGRITFPKGGLELNESYIQTAIREIQEEGGITQVKIINNLGILIRPGYTDENHITPSVIKNIHMFLCTTEEMILEPVVKDIVKAEWIKPENVVNKLSWKEEQDFFIMNKHKIRIT